MLHVEPAVNDVGVAALTRGGGRVSHPHGISLTARHAMVSPLPAGGGSKGRPA